MELALQVVGLKMTGKLEDAKDVAMRIVGNPSDDGDDSQSTPTGHGSMPALQFVTGADLGTSHDFASKVVDCLKLLDSGPTVVSASAALRHSNGTGKTLLHLAAFSGYTPLLDVLIKHNLDLDIRDRNGYTALHLAVLSRSVSSVCALLAGGADPDVVNSCGKTPQEIASPEVAGLFPEDSSSSEEEDDEAQWADVEDEAPTSQRVSRSRRSRSTWASPSISRSSSPPPSERALSRKASDLAMAKQTESIVEMIQRTLGGKFPAAQGLMDNMPALPHLFTLPQLPPLVFPVNIPLNPALIPALPMLFGGDRDGDIKDEPGPTTLNELRATWEKWFALAIATALRQQVDEPPPEYTPRALDESTRTDPFDTSTAKTSVEDLASVQAPQASTSRRPDYDSAPVSTNEVEQYAYQPTRKQKDKLQKKGMQRSLLHVGVV